MLPDCEVFDGPLHGLRVLEFGESIAASTAGMLLAEQGSDVVKVEAPAGDPFRTVPAFEVWNRNKRLVRLDLTDRDGRREACRLLDGAEVLIDGFRAGTLAALGLGAGAVSRPDLITCSIPVTADGSLDLDPAECDSAISAMTAVYGQADRPVFNPLPIASSFAGLMAATSIAAAVHARAEGGRGQAIKVPILSAAMQAAGFRFLDVNTAEHALHVSPAPALLSPLGNTYMCADGRWVQLKAAPRPGRDFASSFFERLEAVTGVPLPLESEAELARALADVFLLHPAEFWETYLSAAGIACAVCRSIEEWLDHPHLREAGLVTEVATPRGVMRQPGPLVDYAGQYTPGFAAPAPVEPADIDWAPQPRGGGPGVTRALAGIKVLDLCILVAGPTCARILSEFGADVVKIDSPRGGMNQAQWLDANRGKRSLLADLKTEDGRKVLWRLIEDADVVVENFRKGVMDSLGFGYDAVSARRPGIVYASINAYGHEGPLADRPGWEHLAQAISGMQLRHGGRGRSPRLISHAITDYASGIGAALGVIGALLRRRRTGAGSHVRSSLAAAAGFMQSMYMYDYPGYERCEVEGRQAMGFSSLSRLYRASDAWLFLHCTPGRRPVLDEVLCLPPRLEGDALATSIAGAISTRPRDHWLAVFEDAGVVAVPVREPADVLSDQDLHQAGLIKRTDTPGYGMVEHTGIVQSMSMTPPVMWRPAPAPGADTRRVLSSLGYTAYEIARMLKSGAVAGG